MEINVDLPIAVYWRLARRYPDLVNGSVINTGEIRGEFLRVLDQGRGVDVNRQINTYQKASLIIGNDDADAAIWHLKMPEVEKVCLAGKAQIYQV